MKNGVVELPTDSGLVEDEVSDDSEVTMSVIVDPDRGETQRCALLLSDARTSFVLT